MLERRPNLNYIGSPRFSKSSPRLAKSNKKSFLPKINERKRMKTGGDLMNTTNSKPLMFNTRSLIF